jgi:hypothetical protein
MEIDALGRVHVTQDHLVTELYKNPELNIFNFLLDDPASFNNSNRLLHTKYPALSHYIALDMNVEDFDKENQLNWFMPDEYKQFDIVEWVLNQCSGEAELQRAGEELLQFQDRDMINLLRYLKYLVDTLRKNKVVWGVGRGSSVASFVLYKIGIHRINSLFYQLPLNEFLK